jgi:hypothetical protein
VHVHLDLRHRLSRSGTRRAKTNGAQPNAPDEERIVPQFRRTNAWSDVLSFVAQRCGTGSDPTRTTGPAFAILEPTGTPVGGAAILRRFAIGRGD